MVVVDLAIETRLLGSGIVIILGIENMEIRKSYQMIALLSLNCPWDGIFYKGNPQTSLFLLFANSPFKSTQGPT